MGYDYLKLSQTDYMSGISAVDGISPEFLSRVQKEIRSRGYEDYYVSFPFNTTYNDNEKHPLNRNYVATVRTRNAVYQLICNCFANIQNAEEKFEAASLDGVVSLKTTETGTENATNAITDHNAASGGNTNISTFSPINSAYEKTSDKTRTDSSATNDRTATTTDEKSASKTTTREEWHGNGTPLETVSAAYMALSPIDRFLNALEMILLTPEEYYEIMGEM